MSCFKGIRMGNHFPGDVRVVILFAVATSAAFASEFTWENAPDSTNWESAANWAGLLGQIPDGDNDTAVVTGTNDIDPILTMDRIIGGLTIGGAADVHTGDGVNNFFLGVSNAGPHAGEIAISGAGSQLLVYEQSGFDVDTDLLMTANGGRVTLVDGGDVRVDNLMTNGGLIRGTGVLQLGGSAESKNEGAIVAAGGTLTINRSSNATLDFDGNSGDGRLEAFFDSTLIIDVPNADPLFDGTIYIENGGEVQITNPWTLNNSAGASLIFSSTTVPGVLSGGHASIRSDVTVHSGGTGSKQTQRLESTRILRCCQAQVWNSTVSPRYWIQPVSIWPMPILRSSLTTDSMSATEVESLTGMEAVIRSRSSALADTWT